MTFGKSREPITGFPGYFIIENGKVYHERFDTFEYGIVQYLSTRIDRAGYRTCRLFTDGKEHTVYIHRLLAEHFLFNQEQLPIVNHLDGNKLNNSLSNLAFTDHAGNIRHGYLTGLIKKKRRKVINMKTAIVYESVREAATQNGIRHSTLKGYLSGQRTNPTSLRYYVYELPGKN